MSLLSQRPLGKQSRRRVTYVTGQDQAAVLGTQRNGQIGATVKTRLHSFGTAIGLLSNNVFMWIVDLTALGGEKWPLHSCFVDKFFRKYRGRAV